MRENAYYNVAVIQANREKHAEAKMLDVAIAEFPTNKDLLSLTGRTSSRRATPPAPSTVVLQAVGGRPRTPLSTSFFLTYNKQNKQAESVAQSSIHKALSKKADAKAGPGR